jgi:organic hydroperoxide reductase OsmC/OhrA
MTTNVHDYAARLRWEGNTGRGTSTYTSYERSWRVGIEGKPDLAGSAAAMFRGDAARHDPEDLFLAAIVSCHMLSYLALCAREGVDVVEYEDEARGRLVLEGGGGRFEEVVLHPTVTVRDEATVELAERLHVTAHELCFIASSCRVPIRHQAVVRVGVEVRA